ncbi:beta strand repeat-containing protein [Gryllotalpicola koreensis]
MATVTAVTGASLVAIAAGGVVLGDAQPAAAADGPAWTCSTYGYLFQSPNGDGTAPPHSIYQVDLVSGASSQIGSTADNVNAVGYNTTDNYIYGVDVTTQKLVQVASDGTLTTLPDPTGYIEGGYNVGDFDSAGHYWVTHSGSSQRWYEIDYAAGSSTYGQILASGTNTGATIGSDWVYVDGSLYTVTNGTDHLVRFDTTTHTATDLGSVPDLPVGTPGYGAGYADAAGKLYFSSNQTGEIYRIDPVSVAAIDLSAGPPSLGNDGVRCANAPIPTVTVQKTVDGRLAASDQFTVGLDNAAGTTLTDVTTAGSATTASTTNWPVSQGETYTITDAMAGGSSSTLAQYGATVVCTDTTTGATVATGGTKGAWTLTVPGEDAYLCNVTNTAPSFTVTKTADATEVNSGETVHYTVTVKNTGSVDYTDANPASFTDDLSSVLDDASYNGDATGGASYAAPTLSWSGALAAGATHTVTYSVTVNAADTGDAHLDNTVVTPADSGGDCPTGTDNAECTVNIPSGQFIVAKTASASTVSAGGTVTYTVTATNTGARDYTAAAPASFSDDLSNVLDDGTITSGPDNGAVVNGNTLSWSGPLAVGATATITYTVTVDNPDTGDGELTNTVRPTSPGGQCAPGECTTTTPIRAFTIAKTASPTGDVTPGDTVTYKVTVTNTGAADFTAADPASFTDDLSKVLDDAQITSGPDNGASISGSTLSWSGPLAVGSAITITYTVTVANPDTGDHDLVNTASAGPGGSCETTDGCTTSDPVKSYTIAKTASATGPAHPGDTITYSVTVTNTGAAAYTAADPASFTDDLSGVLDDGTYVADSASDGASVNGTQLSWSGPLAVGASQTITYKVNVGAAGSGDGTLSNSVAADPDNGGGCAAPGDCTTTNPVQAFSVAKTADATEVNPGDTIHYTVTVTNTGAAPYTAADPASFTDDLSQVTDDATYNGDASNGATVNADTLSWSGPLAVGATETITYSVTVNDPDTGDKHLDNTVVTPTGSGGDCPTGTDNAECTANVPAGSYTVAKTASTNHAELGGKVTYTVTVTNTGNAAYTASKPASFTDDLSNVLDDATYNKDADHGATVSGHTLTWSGPLAVGATVKIAYSVTVNSPDAGNHNLVNTVIPTGDGGQCAADGSCLTTTGAASYTVAKTVSTTDEVQPGATVGYTVTVTNTGQVAYTAGSPASFADDMSDVLDDASYNDDATHGAALSGDVLSWSGALAVGQTVQVTYSVTVNDPDTGNHRLLNTVDPTVGGGSCLADGDCATTTGIITPQDPVVAVNTGGYTVDRQPVWERLLPFGGLTAALLGLGAALVLWMRRKGSQQE